MITIFIVDDDPEICKLYKKLSLLRGYSVIDIAQNGEEAVMKYKSFPIKPDIILMDHRMPQKDGVETTKEIRKISPKQIIIFASADPSIKSMALSVGANFFAVKPFRFDELVEIINKLI